MFIKYEGIIYKVSDNSKESITNVLSWDNSEKKLHGIMVDYITHKDEVSPIVMDPKNIKILSNELQTQLENL